MSEVDNCEDGCESHIQQPTDTVIVGEKNDLDCNKSTQVQDSLPLVNGEVTFEPLTDTLHKKCDQYNSHKNGMQLLEINRPIQNGTDTDVSTTGKNSNGVLISCSNKDIENVNKDSTLESKDSDSSQVGATKDSLSIDLTKNEGVFHCWTNNCKNGAGCCEILEKPKIDLVNKSFKTLSINKSDTSEQTVTFVGYESEAQMPEIMTLITQDLSEPYSVYTYRYFLHNWPNLSHLAYCNSECIGAVVCKLDFHQKNVWRGYIAMLVIHKEFRKKKIGSNLVKLAIKKMVEQGCDEVVLETEVTNKAALGLYENLGFVRDKRLLRYYLNGVDAWRLKLWLR